MGDIGRASSKAFGAVGGFGGLGVEGVWASENGGRGRKLAGFRIRVGILRLFFATLGRNLEVSRECTTNAWKAPNPMAELRATWAMTTSTSPQTRFGESWQHKTRGLVSIFDVGLLEAMVHRLFRSSRPSTDY